MPNTDAVAKIMDPFDRALKGDVDFFKEVALNVLEQSRNEHGDSVLMIAAMENHLECCRQIVNRSPASVYHQNLSGYTALHVAAMKGRTEICKFLIYANSMTYNQHGDIESGSGGEIFTPNKKLLTMVTGNSKGTALHFAVYHNHPETVKILIQADPTHELLRIVDYHKRTALHYAVKFQSLVIVKLLVEQEPDFTYHVDDYGDTPLLEAMTLAQERGEENSVMIRNLLIKKQASQIKLRVGDEGWTLLHHAAVRGDLSAIENIIPFAGDCLELVDFKSRNFLHLAAYYGHVKAVEYILGIKDISPWILNAQDIHGDTPLHIAARKGYASAARALLYDSRVYKMIKNGKGQTAVELITFDYDKERAQVFGVRDAVNEKKLKDRSDFDLVVCALIATVSFTAGITVPGGYISQGQNQGMAVLSKRTTFEAFAIANTCALLLSLSAVFGHFSTRIFHRRKDIDFQVTMATLCTLGAIFAMVVAFITGSYAVLAISTGLAISICVLSGGFFLFAFYSMWKMAMQYHKLHAQAASTDEQGNRPSDV